MLREFPALLNNYGETENLGCVCLLLREKYCSNMARERLKNAITRGAVGQKYKLR